MKSLNNTLSYFSLLLSVLIFGICFSFSQSSYSQLSDDNDIDIFLDALIGKGDALVDENRYDEAIEYYDKALQISPDDIETLFKKGEALYSLGNYTDAIQYYDKVLEIDPTYIDALNGKGKALSAFDYIDEAIGYFDKVLEIDPNNTEALYNKGLVLGTLGRTQEEIQYYDKVLAINSTDTDALLNKGLALGYLGKHLQEIQYYDKVLEIDPNNTEALYNKGLVFYSLGNYNEARGYFDKVLEIDPNNTEALITKNDAADKALNALNYNTDSNNDAVNNIENKYATTQEGNWKRICNMVQSALYQSCNIYVNDNGILTTEGERAFGCIRNGALLGGGALTLGLPPGLITKGLEMLSTPTGCDGIVNFQALNAIGNLGTILGLLP